METLSRAELDALQVQRLRRSVVRSMQAPIYRDGAFAGKLDPETITSIDDIRRLPFTTKDDLRANGPFAYLTVPLSEIVRIHSSSGTTGTAVSIFHTSDDLANWTELVARCMAAVGLSKEDVFQNIAGYGLFTGGLGFHYGSELLGMTTIPAGPGNSNRHIQLMQTFGTTVAHLMPSYALSLMRNFEALGVDPKTDTKLHTLFLGAEPHSEETRLKIEEFYGAKAYNSYGLTEMNGPGLSFECPARDGMHIWEDQFVVELIDPDGDQPVAEGEVGELVYTTLARVGMPIFRYRSRDLAAFIAGPCGCGRSHRRITRLMGRVDDMIIYKGVNIYPIQIEKVLSGYSGITDNFLIVLENDQKGERITVEIDTEDRQLTTECAESDRLRKSLIEALRSEILVTVRIEFRQVAGDDALPRMKPKRIDDRRLK
ncbi:MAG: phenylacetate--CoA ligase [Rhodospirillaceae bacterium]|nr:phenylacetate--CoA ligase [Rhodospirillaceae bacterium]